MTDVTAPTCPDCGATVVWDFTCHTYGSGDRWYACMPCDSAIEYMCDGTDDGGCGWQYTHGLNPHNPRSGDNESRRPSWCPPLPVYHDGIVCPVPGVESI